MGFWQGLNAGLTEVMAQKERQKALEAQQAESEKDRAFQREMFQKEVLEKYRATTLELAGKRQEQADALRQKVEYGVSIGMNEVTATALLQSGQLDLFLNLYDKNPYLDPNYMDNLNVVVANQLKEYGPEAMSGAMIAGVSTPRDTKDPQESQMAITEAILTASSPEQLDAMYTNLLKGGTPTTKLPRFDVNFSTMNPQSSETNKAIARQIAEGTGGYFKDSYTVTSSGETVINQNAPSEVLTLFNEAKRKAVELSTGPTAQYSPAQAAEIVSSRLEYVVRGAKGSINPIDIVNNFDLVLTDPDQYLNLKMFTTPTPVPVPVPEVPTAEQVTAGKMDPSGNTWNFNVNEFNSRQ